VKRAVVIFSLLCLGCQSQRAKSNSDPHAAGAASARAATTPRTLIAAAQDLVAAGGDRDSEEWAAAELTRIATRVRAERQRDPTAAPSAAINRTIFDVLGFQREVDDQDIRYVLLPSVLRLRRGSCVGLGVLYVALGALLDVPIRGVMVPGHFYVRIDENGRARNTELLRRGEEMPAAWYVNRYPIAGGSAPAYARPLTTTEVVGVIEYNVGQQSKRLGRLADAGRAYGQASAHFPMFAEAAASLGATLHLLGDLDQAAAAYQAAVKAYPELPGLKENINVLGQERRNSGASLTQFAH
jgi:tetratricopeptide (TPR) repeat protein